MSAKAPIFPSSMISAGTTPVSLIYTPQPGIHSPHLIVRPDSFAMADTGASKSGAPLRDSAGRFRRAEPSDGYLRTQGESALARLSADFERARASRASGDTESARAHYEEAFKSLDSPAAPAAEPAPPMYLEIENGRELYTEALFESCVLSLADRSPLVLRRLHRYLSDAEGRLAPEATERAKAKILQAYAIMQHTSSTFESRDDIFESGLTVIGDVIERLKAEPRTRTTQHAIDLHKSMTDSKGTARQLFRSCRRLKRALEKVDAEKKAGEGHGDARKETGASDAEMQNGAPDFSYTAQFLKGFTLISLGMNASAPRLHLMRKAKALLEEAAGELEPSSGPRAADAHFSMQLLRSEILARELVLAHGRRDAPDRKRLARELYELFASAAVEHSTDERRGIEPKYAGTLPAAYKNEVIASYQADAAILMARLGMWNNALFWARAVTSGQFESTRASSRLLTEPIFRPFIMNNSFLNDAQIKARLKEGSWVKRFHAALRQQHSIGAMQSLSYGMLGMLPGFTAHFFTDLNTPAMCMAGVLVSTAFNRIKNGWTTEEAKYAAITRKYERTPVDTMKDAGRLAVHSSFDSLPWAFPSAFLELQDKSIDIIVNTFSRSFEVAGDKLSGIGALIADPAEAVRLITSAGASSPDSLLNSAAHAAGGISAALFASNFIWPELTKFFRQENRWLWLTPGLAQFGLDFTSMQDAELLRLLHDTYTYGAAVLFLRQMWGNVTEWERKYLNIASIGLLPGAFMLSADIGCWLAPGDMDPTYGERIIRASLLAVESYLMMHILGNAKWRWDHSQTATSNVMRFIWRTVNANPAIPLSMVIVNAFTAPLGGYSQRDKNLDHIALIALQGVTTTICMLPITLGISGVLKQTIPLFTRAREGLEDSRAAGDGAAMRAYHTLVGAASAFNTSYAHNRIFRSGTWDIIPSTLRTLLGWDTFAGQMGMSATNIVHGNGVSTRMWPDLSGTTWARQSIKKEFESATRRHATIREMQAKGSLSEEDADRESRMIHAQTRTFFQKSAQVMHAAHLFMAHESLADRLIPFYSFTMAAHPPSFPLMPDRHFLADFYLMLHGGHSDERLTTDEFRTFLDYVKTDAAEPSAYDTVRPLVQLLALARENMDPEYREVIAEFFEENPEVALMVNVDLAAHAPLLEKYRRIARKKVRSAVRMDYGDYERRVNGHRRQKRAHSKLDGLFLSITGRDQRTDLAPSD